MVLEVVVVVVVVVVILRNREGGNYVCVYVCMHSIVLMCVLYLCMIGTEGLPFSPDDIEHGILRGNLPHPSSNSSSFLHPSDERAKLGTHILA